MVPQGIFQLTMERATLSNVERLLINPLPKHSNKLSTLVVQHASCQCATVDKLAQHLAKVVVTYIQLVLAEDILDSRVRKAQDRIQTESTGGQSTRHVLGNIPIQIVIDMVGKWGWVPTAQRIQDSLVDGVRLSWCERSNFICSRGFCKFNGGQILSCSWN